MTRLESRISVAFACIVLIAVVAYQSQAQTSVPEQQSRTGQTQTSDSFSNQIQQIPASAIANYRQWSSASTVRTLSAQSAKVSRKTSEAVKKYKAAKSDDERTAVEKELRTVLSDHFDLLIKERETQLADLKARLERLTTQLEKRREAKDEIVDLRLKVVINEANGLGFYPNQSSSTSRSRSSFQLNTPGSFFRRGPVDPTLQPPKAPSQRR